MTHKHRPLVVLLALAAFACGGTTPTPTNTAAGTTTTAPPPAPASHGEEQAAPAPPSDPEPTPPVESAPPDLLAEERAEYERARPVFEKHCARCHTSTAQRPKRAALRHFNMDSYPLAGHHAAEIAGTVREVLGLTGEKPTMPDDEPGAVQGDELQAIAAWADAFDRAHAAGVHGEQGGHAH